MKLGRNNPPSQDREAETVVPRRRLTVLLVEQHSRDAERVTKLLAASRSTTFDIEPVEEITPALERIERGGVDAVLLGIAMPDGLAVSTIRSVREAAPELPIIVLTSFPDERFGLQALNEGAQDCLSKNGLEAHALERAIGYALERHRVTSKYAEELWSAGVLYEDFLNIVRNSADAIVIVNQDGLVEFMNPYAESLFGYEPGAATGQPFDFPLTEAEAVEIDVDSPWRKVRAEMRVVETGWKGARARLAVLRDITERRELEARLAQAQKLESVGQLAAGIAHEINTPIQFITDNTRYLGGAFAELNAFAESHDQLREGEDAEALARLDELRKEIPEALKDSLEGLDEVSRIVHAMRTFAHPGPQEKTPSDINQAVESTIAVSRNEWKDVATVETVLEADLPLVSVVPGDINQVLLNLIVNGAHAIADVAERGPGGRGTITVTTRRDGDWVEIRVADTGAGIPEEIRQRIFDPFFTTKDVGRGTGQGLSICRSVIVERHHGTIQFETTTGVGTTFVVRLPLGEQAAAA